MGAAQGAASQMVGRGGAGVGGLTRFPLWVEEALTQCPWGVWVSRDSVSPRGPWGQFPPSFLIGENVSDPVVPQDGERGVPSLSFP